MKDHPHACGDKLRQDKDLTQAQGSSPRVWGQVSKITYGRQGFKDHPHACGDKYLSLSHFLILSGSSPRVWGQGSIILLGLSLIGIIPTRVGTRTSTCRYKNHGKDHPHACGDKVLQESTTYVMLGSSPRVWGQVTYKDFARFCKRIIPTRVGTRRTTSIL